MPIRKLYINRKSIKILLPLLNFLIGTFLVLVYSVADYLIFKKDISLVNSKNISKKILEQEEYFINQIKESQYFLTTLRNNRLFENYLNNKKESKLYLEYLFENSIKTNTSIMQIRFINKKGEEVIRFDRTEAYSKSIKKINKLQNKSHRYYFINNIKDKEEIWYSALDLNEENEKIEIPYNPTFRVVLPVVHEGSFKGMIVVNYFAQMVFDKLFTTSLYDYLLVDIDGYTLCHHDKNKMWSRYSKSKEKIDIESITKEYQIKKLNLPFLNELFLILSFTKESLEQQESVYKKSALLLVVAFIGMLLFISFILYFILKLYEEKKFELEVLYEDKNKQDNILKQKSKMAAMGEMIGNIAHQWRQPLALLSYHNINFDRKFKKDNLSKEFIERYLEETNETIDEMNQTIEDFIGFFKPNKTKVRIELTELIKESILMFEKTAKYDNLKIEFIFAGKYKLISYRNELLQVFLNILNNSRDAIKKNNIDNGKIIIEVFQDTNNYIICFFDNGGGINEDILKRVFEPYFTTKFKSKGIGLGLYMSKMIIEDSLNGTINLEKSNDGTLCTIVLPKKGN